MHLCHQTPENRLRKRWEETMLGMQNHGEVSSLGRILLCLALQQIQVNLNLKLEGEKQSLSKLHWQWHCAEFLFCHASIHPASKPARHLVILWKIIAICTGFCTVTRCNFAFNFPCAEGWFMDYLYRWTIRNAREKKTNLQKQQMGRKESVWSPDNKSAFYGNSPILDLIWWISFAFRSECLWDNLE